MSRVTTNRKIEDLGNGNKRAEAFNAPAFESEAARQDLSPLMRHVNLAIDLTAVALTAGGVDSDAPAYFIAARAGFIDSFTYDISAAISAGGASAFALQCTVNGTATGNILTVPSGGGSAVSGVQDQTTPVAFAEGDKLSLVVTTSHTFAPTTADLAAALFIRYAA
jgi:hypothetical protein